MSNEKTEALINKRLGLDGPIEIGAIVRLRSGGPSMTFEKISETKKVHCVWFDKDRPRDREFDMALLQKTTPEQIPVLIIEGPAQGDDDLKNQ